VLLIRDYQLEKFRLKARRAFAKELVAHVTEHFAAQCQFLPSEELLEILQSGIERASRYGFNSRKDVCKFINIMFAFGYNFDTDPDIDWSSPYLNGNASGSERMRKLYSEAMLREDTGRGLNYPPPQTHHDE